MKQNVVFNGPEGVTLTPVAFVGSSLIAKDAKGQLYQIFPKFIGAVPCKNLCGHDMERFHITCMYCRSKRVAQGKIPHYIRVEPQTVFIWKDRFAYKAKNIILKKLFNIVEMLA
jgi:DNA-directed RNA polymerase subunit RPC12/RpoP